MPHALGDEEDDASRREADHNLIARARDGHRPSFEQLVRTTARLVWSRHALHVRDRSAVDDLVQETFLRAWQHIHTLRSPDGFRAWLLTLADRVRLDAHKHATRKKRMTPFTQSSSEDADTAPASLALSPEAQATSTEEKERLRAALRALPEQYQQVLALRYLGGADSGTIAADLALTQGQVRGLLHRGLELLRQQLAPAPRPAEVAITGGAA